MPQRSNAFQALIHRIESVLHDAPAKVDESMLVLNEDTGKTEEIDIVVSFEVGGRAYRTGIAVRERKRDKGDKDWIRALGAQRTECKLDRMIAVHSLGFSGSARKVAKTHNVELIHPAAINDEQLLQILLPVDGVDLSRAQFHSLGFQSNEKNPKGDGKLKLLVPEREPYDEPALHALVHVALQRDVPRVSESGERLDIGRLLNIRFRALLKVGTEIELDSGERYAVTYMVGNVEMQLVRASFGEASVVDYGGTPVLSAKGDVPESHLTTRPAGDGKVKVEAKVLMDPGPSPIDLDLPDLRIDELA